MIGAARPRVSARIIRHARTHGVEFDIPVAVQHIAFAVDQAGFVTAFPQRAGTTVASVELADVAASEFLHQACNSSDFWRRGQQMHMVVHQDVRVQLATCVEQCLAKQREVALPIVVVEKAGQAIVAALDNVLRNAGKVESWLSGHRVRIGMSMPRRYHP